MAKRFLFLTGILISAQLISAQDYFIKGYIINQNRDTIHGLINDLDWDYNPDIIDFKEDSSSTVQKFTPNDITEFKTKDNYYISFNGKLDITPVKLEELHEKLEITYLTISTFLRVVNKGKVNLYEYHSVRPDKYIYLIQKGNENITELIYQKKMYIKNGKRLVQTNEFYKNQLESYLIDCKDAVKSIKNTKYTLYSLYKRVNIYNTCGSEKKTGYHDFAKKNKPKMKISILSGFTVNNFVVYKPHFIDDHIQLEGPVTLYMPGLAFEWFFPRSRETSSLFVNMSYNSFYKENIDESNFFKYEYYFSAKHLKITGAYKKYFSPDNKEFRPYIYGGIFTIMGGIDYTIISTHTTLGNSYTKFYSYGVPVNFRIGGGFDIRDKFVVDFSYDYYLLKDDALKYRTINFLVGYSFNF